MINSRKYYFTIGLICLLALMCLSVIFFEERIAFCDTAYQAVCLLIEQNLQMNWIRPGACLPQIIPLVAIWLHTGLKTVMILHSVAFILFFLIIYLLAYKYSAKKLLFFIIPLYLVLITNDVFYWPQSELQQGMIWLCLYAVLLFENKWHSLSPQLQWCAHFLSILWIQFFHPLMLFPTVFLLIYYYDSDSQLFSRKSMYHIALCGLIFVLRTVMGLFDPYERGKFNLLKALKKHHFHFFSLDSVQMFFGKLGSGYLIYLLLFAGGLIWLLVHKKYVKSVSLLLFSLGYWMLIMFSAPDNAAFLVENMLLPLGFMAALPIVADMIPGLKMSYSFLFFLAVIVIRLGFIYDAHREYTAHLNIYDHYFSYIKKNKLNGVLVDDKLIDQKKTIITWGSGYESVLISSLASPDSCMVVQIDSNVNRYKWCLNDDTSLVTIYGAWGHSQLPEQYFRLAGGKYEILTKQP